MIPETISTTLGALLEYLRPNFLVRNILAVFAKPRVEPIACWVKTSPLFKIARVPVRFNHAARCIVNANHSVI
jgi:hypothetical protein